MLNNDSKFILVLYVSQWSSFSDCSATCNAGNQIRSRTRVCSPANLCKNIDVLNTVPCNKEFACPGMIIIINSYVAYKN